MMDLIIEELIDKQKAPFDLLLNADPSEELVRSYLACGKCIIAKQNAEVIGVLVYKETGTSIAEIMNVSVRMNFQNRGVGKSLILHAVNKARAEKYKVMEIGTGNPGVLQMLLYQKCGFRIVGVDFDFFRRNYKERIYENGIECRDMIRMRMEL